MLALAHHVDPNTLGALEGAVLVYEHFVLDHPVFNNSLIGGEGFVEGVSQLDNLIAATEHFIESIENGNATIIHSDLGHTLLMPDGGSILFYETDPEQLFKSIHPYILLMSMNHLSTLNLDAVVKLEFQRKFNGRDYHKTLMSVHNMMFAEWKHQENMERLESLTGKDWDNEMERIREEEREDNREW